MHLNVSVEKYSYKNPQILNFDSLRDQQLHKAAHGEFLYPKSVMDEDGGVEETKESEPEFGPPPKKPKLLLHTNKMLMKRNKFQLEVAENPSKKLNMTYDTLPFGRMHL